MGREHSRWTGWHGNRARADYAAAVMAAAFLCALPAWGQPELNVVGTWGGAVNAVFVDEGVNPDIAYVGSGRRLVILNVADPTNILELGSVDLQATILDLAVRDSWAFVGTADAPNFFCVVDVSNFSDPQLVWHDSRRTGQSREVELYLSLAYVRFDQDLLVFDISNPTAPVVNRGAAIASIVESVEIEGDLMFIGSGPPEPRQLRIYDLTIDPINVGSSSLIGWVELPGSESQPRGLAVDGTYAYVTTPTSNGTFAVVNVSNPREPFVEGSYQTCNAFDVGLGTPDVVYVVDCGELLILDVSQPAAPTRITSIGTHAAVRGVEVAGNRAYVMDNGEGLIILDVSSPATPVRLGNWHSPVMLRKMDKVGDLLYVTDAANGISILDVSDPTTPVLVAAYQTAGDPFLPNGAGNGIWNVDVRNGMAYLSAGRAGFEVVNVSDPANPVLAGAFTFAGPEAVALRLSPIHSDILHVGVQPGAWIYHFDISDPRKIVEVGVRLFLGGSNAKPYTIEFGAGDLAHIAKDGANHVVELADPAAPRMIGTQQWNNRGAPYELALADNIRYVTNPDFVPGVGGLYVQDVSDPSNPQPLAFFPSLVSNGVAVQGQRAYLAGGYQPVNGPCCERGVLVLDVSQPSNPTQLATLRVPSSLWLLVEEPYVYLTTLGSGGVGSGGPGLVILEVSGLRTPGDLNCDGAVNGADIDPFFLALGDPPAYALAFPNCDPLNGDMNGDGRLDGGDIDPFFECLGGGNCP